MSVQTGLDVVKKNGPMQSSSDLVKDLECQIQKVVTAVLSETNLFILKKKYMSLV